MIGKTNVKVKPNKKVEYVDFIESTGTQYIDTGVGPNDNITVEIKTSTKLDGTNLRALFGSRNSSSSDATRFALFFGDYDGSIYCDFQYSTHYRKPSLTNYISSDVPAILKFGKKGLFVNETQVGTAFSVSVLNATKNMFLCAINTGGSASGFYAGKIYYCKIYNGDTLIRDFKPVKDGTGEYCLYDEVEKRYYYNQGSGEFLGGVAA